MNIIVEGQTEEAFVNQVLVPHFAERGIGLRARPVTTSRDWKRGRVERGGLVTYGKVRYDVVGWLQEDPTAYLTTMLDYFRLPEDTPGYDASAREPDVKAKAETLEEAIAADIGYGDRFRPYVQMHEFEALLFCDVPALDRVMVESDRASRREAVQNVVESVSSPEEINDGPVTAPSKRLNGWYPGYIDAKRALGVSIARAIGLVPMRARCPHFDNWISRLERLAGSSGGPSPE